MIVTVENAVGRFWRNPTPHPNRAEQVAGFGVLVGFPVGAYFIGRSLDRHEVSIILSPADTSR